MQDLVLMLLRFLHFLFGITWIGLLYYFNFVQVPTMPKVPAELKPGVSKYIAPAALFRDSNPLDPTGKGDYFINCSNPLLSAQERTTLCTPAQIAADTANPGSATAQVRIGRRNIEGGGRFSDYEHENYRAAFGAKGARYTRKPAISKNSAGLMCRPSPTGTPLALC